ncbi:hypothetical protein GF377_09930, partial [candidate division GN15 bacterium]|nr:hypothetical protein [candidate division GN15 bacterium]
MTSPTSNSRLYVLSITVLLAVLCPTADAQVIVNHQAVAAFDTLASAAFPVVRDSFSIFYGHTSHGSQIVTGLSILQSEDPLYDPPNFLEIGDDLGHNG